MQTPFEINTTSNRLLRLLSQGDRDRLGPHMTRVTLAVREELERPNEPIRSIYFPEDGIASVVGSSHTMGDMAVGMIGKEGMTGLMVVLGNDRGPLTTFVQVAGSAMSIAADDLRREMQANASIRDLFLSYVQVFLIQTSQTAVANAAGLLPQRLARWLLMCEDRLTSKIIPITHEFLSIMLGVHRSGVTIAMGQLESHGMIKGERARVSILDRPSMIKLANGIYGAAEAQYERLFGPKPYWASES